MKKLETRNNHLYRVVCDRIRKKILSGVYGAGSTVLSEAQLCEEHEASRITIKRSLQILKDEGLVRSIPGSGWEVVSNSPAPDAARISLGACLFITSGAGLVSQFQRTLGARLRAMGGDLRVLFFENNVMRNNPDIVLEECAAYPEARSLVFASAGLAPEKLFSWARGRSMHFIGVGVQEMCGYDTVAMDNFDAVRQLVRLLARRGHRQIMFAAYSPLIKTAPSFRNRFFGYEDEMRAQGLEPLPLLIPQGGLSQLDDPELGELLARLGKQGKRPTAIISSAAQYAMALARSLARRGLQLPREMSLVSVGTLDADGEELKGLGLPGISGIAEPWEDIGHAVAATIIARHLGVAGCPRLTLVPGQLIDSGSIHEIL